MNEFQEMIVHEPILPPRTHHIGEHVFAEKWKQLMQQEIDDYEYPHTTKLEHVLSYSYPFEVGQREASIAASFVTWLGTNMGNSFITRAQMFADTYNITPESAFIAAWAMQNAREHATNHGTRTIEVCVKNFSTESNYISASSLPELSGRDYEVVESVVRWLSTPNGQNFFTECEQEVQKREKQKRENV